MILNVGLVKTIYETRTKANLMKHLKNTNYEVYRLVHEAKEFSFLLILSHFYVSSRFQVYDTLCAFYRDLREPVPYRISTENAPKNNAVEMKHKSKQFFQPQGTSYTIRITCAKQIPLSFNIIGQT